MEFMKYRTENGKQIVVWVQDYYKWCYQLFILTITWLAGR